MRDDYYLTLGISWNESPSGVQRAFRDLARRYPPGAAGPSTMRSFQDMVEAYEVLSDPRSRASYDARRERLGSEARRVRSAAPEPEIEPLVPGTLQLMRDFEVTRPPREDVEEWIWRSFAEPRSARPGRLDVLDLELLLTSEEAARGGALTIGVPLYRPCASCHGTGSAGWGYRCSACGGNGAVEVQELLTLTLPRDTRDGTVFEVPLCELGIDNLCLHVLVRVGA